MQFFKNVWGPRRWGVALLFFVLAAPTWAANLPVSRVLFEGDVPFSQGKALKLTGIRPGLPFDEAAAVAGHRALRTACINRYYPLADTTWTVQKDRGERSVTLIYRIKTGEKGKMVAVKISGNTSVSSSNLVNELVFKPAPGFWNWFYGRDTLMVDDLPEDRERLANYYRQQGYLDVEVGPARLDYDRQRKGFILTWPVMSEGRQYRVRDIVLEGPMRPADKDLNSIITLRSGSPFGSDAAEASRLALHQFFKLNGYAFATVDLDAQVGMEEALVDVTYRMEAGPQPSFGELILRGNEVTDDRVFRREIMLEKGAPFYPPALEAAKSRILMLPMVEAAAMEAVEGANSNLYDVVLSLKERRTGRFEIGYVYGEVEGGAFQLNVRELNLKLTPPFRGDAYQGNINLTAGPSIRKLDLGVLNPRVENSFWSLDTRATYEDNEYASDYYDQESIALNLTAGHPLSPYQVGNIGLQVQNIDVYDVIPEAAGQISETEDDLFVTAITLGWMYDRANRAFRPDQGFRLRAASSVGTQLLGGDDDLIQYKLGGSWFFNPVDEHILVLRGGIEGVSAYGDTATEPYSSRVFLGGVSDLRGFGYHTVSPVDEEGRLTGGETAWFATLEYLYPVNRIVDMAIYYDVGDVSASGYGANGPVSNWGLGFMIRADNFPVRFDVAFPLSTYTLDTNNEVGDARISFSAGYTY